MLTGAAGALALGTIGGCPGTTADQQSAQTAPPAPTDQLTQGQQSEVESMIQRDATQPDDVQQIAQGLLDKLVQNPPGTLKGPKGDPGLPGQAGQPGQPGARSWSELQGIPDSLKNGDNDTLYMSGSGLALNGATFSIAPGGVTVDKLADGSVTSAKLAAGAVTAAKLYTGLFDPNDPNGVPAGTIDAALLKLHTITADRFAPNAVREALGLDPNALIGDITAVYAGPGLLNGDASGGTHGDVELHVNPSLDLGSPTPGQPGNLHIFNNPGKETITLDGNLNYGGGGGGIRLFDAAGQEAIFAALDNVGPNAEWVGVLSANRPSTQQAGVQLWGADANGGGKIIVRDPNSNYPEKITLAGNWGGTDAGRIVVRGGETPNADAELGVLPGAGGGFLSLLSDHVPDHGAQTAVFVADGGNGGALLSMWNGGNDDPNNSKETIRLDAQDNWFGGGKLQVNAPDGNKRAELWGSNQAYRPYAGLRLFGADPYHERINLEAGTPEGADGGTCQLTNGSGTWTASFSGGGANAGSKVSMWNGGNGDPNNNRETITLDANGTGGEPEITLKPADGTTPSATMHITGNYGGEFLGWNNSGKNTFGLTGGVSGGGAFLNMSNGRTPNAQTVQLLADGYGGVGLLALANSTGDVTIAANADTAGFPAIDLADHNVARARITLSGSHNGEVRLRSHLSDTVNTAVLGGGDAGGELDLYSTAGDLTVQMYGGPGSATFKGVVTACRFDPVGGCDVAESFDHSEPAAPQPGLVMVIDAVNPGKLTLSTQAYDKKVAGIVSGAGGLKPGMVLGGGKSDPSRAVPSPVWGQTAPMDESANAGQHVAEENRREDTPALMDAPGGTDDLPLALAGRVYCYVDATENAVEVGDLLTTSDTPGYAMKASDQTRAFGAVLGKAMEPLPKGEKGLILVLVALQ